MSFDDVVSRQVVELPPLAITKPKLVAQMLGFVITVQGLDERLLCCLSIATIVF
jgi:hypothetical protein